MVEQLNLFDIFKPDSNWIDIFKPGFDIRLRL